MMKSDKNTDRTTHVFVWKIFIVGVILFLSTFSLYTAIFDLPFVVSLIVATILTVAITTLFKIFILSDISNLKNRIEKLEQAKKTHRDESKSLIKKGVELTRAHEKLEELDERKSNFVSVVAHQLRTPISAVKWTLNMIMNGELGPINKEQRAFLEKCYESNDRMIKLVNNMLNVDRIQSGKTKFDPRPVNIVDILGNVLFEVSPRAHQKNIYVEFTKPEVVPEVYVDPDSMRGVFQNLLENAIKYTINNSKVNVDLKIESGHILVSVKDTGIGIPQNQQKNVFDKFFRSQNAIKQETDGTGLGLFITKSIVEEHGGKIWFESIEGKGTTFFFTIPFGKKI
jgi:signal transduction histidine kinase